MYDGHTSRHVASFKRPNTARNGLAVSDTHIYAAQAEKAVVNVYSREKGLLAHSPNSSPYLRRAIMGLHCRRHGEWKIDHPGRTFHEASGYVRQISG